MKTVKRILSVLLALLTVFSVMAVGVGSVTVSAATNGVFEYSILENNTVCLDKVVDMDYTGKTLVIPAEIDGKKVIGTKSRSEFFFRDLIESGNIDSITSLKIEEGIVEVNAYGEFNALYDPEDREYVNYEEQGVFAGLKNLRNVSLPKSLKILDNGMFSNCTSLRKITIPENVEYFGYNVFGGCTSLKYVKLPSKMKYISRNMFKNCKSLVSIKLPSSIRYIEDSAFAYCESLTSGGLEFPKNLEEIGERAFYSCKSLTGKRKIPKKLKKLGDGAFAFCYGLTGFRIADGNKHFSYKNGALFNKNKTKIYCYLPSKEAKEYKVPSTVKSAAKYVFAGARNLKKVTLSSKMTSTGYNAFYKSKVKEVILPKSIQRIDASAFESCKNIKTIKLPSKLKEISAYAFKNCTNLTEIKIPSKVKSIGAFVFKGCDKLRSLTFPKSVSTISLEAFDNCKNLKTVKILNKKCDIYFWKDKVSGSKPTIYGYKNSTAQKFAKKAKLKFVAIK